MALLVGAIRADAATLPISTFGAIVYDPGHHHIFVTGGPGTTFVFVLDDSAKLVKKLQSGAGSGPDGMVISSDGSTLFVALADSDKIARFSTGTLSERTALTLPAPVDHPSKLALAGGSLWTGFCGGGGGFASISLADDSVSAYQGPDYPACSRLRGGGPGASDRIFAWNPFVEPGGVSEFQITSGVPSLVKAATLTAQGRLPDVAASKDGSAMYAAHVAPGSVGEYSTSDLAPTGTSYSTGDHTAAVAVDDKDRIFAGTFLGGLAMFIPGTEAAAWSEAIDNGGVWDQGVATNPAGSRVFIVVGELFSYVTLKVAFPDQTSTPLTINAGRSLISYGSGTIITVHASLDGATPQRHVTVQQRPIDGVWRNLATGVMNSSGTLRLTVRPKLKTDYRAVYRGDELNAPSGSTAVRVRVAAIAQGRLVNFDERSGKYFVYRLGSNVGYLAGVIPRHHELLRFRLQKGVAAGWHLLGVVKFTLGKDGVVLVGVNPRILHRGDRFRIRSEFTGDRDHAGDNAPFRYFRIT